jgi:hypothetical protein
MTGDAPQIVFGKWKEPAINADYAQTIFYASGSNSHPR